MQIKPLPSLDRLNEIFTYDPSLGEIFWKVRRGPRVAGTIAGSTTSRGYRSIMVDGENYQAHRIIWKMHNGVEPALHIDHRNRKTAKNKIGNLREATVSQNLCNAKVRSDNKSGIKGVSFNRASGKWRGYVILHQKQYECGLYQRLEDAAQAVKDARDRLHGEFARIA